MEFHVTLIQPVADLAAVADAVRAIDPVGQVDIDKPGKTLRVAAHVEASELVSVLSGAGCAVSDSQVVQLPSICCGGCGG